MRTKYIIFPGNDHWEWIFFKVLKCEGENDLEALLCRFWEWWVYFSPDVNHMSDFFKHYKVHYKVLKNLNQTYMYNRTAMHNAESVTKTNSTKKDQWQ